MSNPTGVCNAESHTIKDGECMTCLKNDYIYDCKEPDYAEITKATMDYVTYTGEGCNDTPEGISKDMPVGFTPSFVKVRPVDGKRDFKLESTFTKNDSEKPNLAILFDTGKALEWKDGEHPLVNSDSQHYQMVDGIESILLMESMFSIEELMAWAKITSYKYRFRLGKKDDDSKDIKKMKTYEAYYKALRKKRV